MRLDVIAERFDLETGKCVVETFQFLQAADIGGDLFQPRAQMLKPLTDGIDVPGGDAHRANFPLNQFRMIGVVKVMAVLGQTGSGACGLTLVPS